MFADSQQGLRNSNTNAVGEEVVQLQLMDPYYAFDNSMISWGICSLSTNKNKCLQFLDIMLTDHEVLNMIYWGIEGEHYKFVNKENGFIDYADGLDISTTTYRNGIGLYGDKRYVYSYVTSGSKWQRDLETKQADLVTAAKAFKERRSKGNGFVYDSSKMTTQIANVSSKISEYAKILALGKGDTAYYNQFISALNAAGMKSIIADKQAQLNAWLALQNK